VHAQTVAEDAERANRLKDEFLATVSHELRTPLNAVLGWARMLGAQQTSPDRTKHGIATIERNALAVVHIIDDLLDVSRSIAGTFHLDTQPVDLVAVARAAMDLVRPLADAKNVHLSFSAGIPSDRDLRGDPGRLEQVVWNLLANAIKFTPAGGRVTVRLSHDATSVVLLVQDNGMGISPSFLPQVFDRFTQHDSSTTRSHGGMGLGLAIVRHLAELHGGSVSAESEGPGRGATFVVRLPLRSAAEGEQATGRGEVPLTPDAAAMLGGVRALVVDDERDSRDLLASILSEAGATVLLAASAAEALEMLGQQHVDVVLADIAMPDADGYWLIERIRAHPSAVVRGVPAMAVTACARREDEQRALLAGFQEHVRKPIEVNALRDGVRRLVIA
ncbi:MAG TPA: hybrid sensor histidine kinase/response regulator, partial [Vicinamibacterales bacterium]|nr:hybrid sensor histidine kinase/response regulator [Vicinamibacterales bacterium]